jgi:hypothetical protein
MSADFRDAERTQVGISVTADFRLSISRYLSVTITQRPKVPRHLMFDDKENDDGTDETMDSRIGALLSLGGFRGIGDLRRHREHLTERAQLGRLQLSPGHRLAGLYHDGVHRR